jgi:FkbM family methyltransferase
LPRVAKLEPGVGSFENTTLVARISRRFRRLIDRRHHGRALTKSEIHTLVSRDDPLILEIGCNDGTDTLEFLGEFPDLRIHCFECDPRPIGAFRSRIRDSRCALHEIALSDRAGVATLHMSGGTREGVTVRDWDQSSSLLEPTGHRFAYSWITFERDCEVETARLDDWASRVIPDEVVDFVWMDVQGAEHLVIAGGASTFARTRFCYFEYSDSELYRGQRDLSALLTALGPFRLLGTYENNALAINTTLA